MINFELIIEFAKSFGTSKLPQITKASLFSSSLLSVGFLSSPLEPKLFKFEAMLVKTFLIFLASNLFAPTTIRSTSNF